MATVEIGFVVFVAMSAVRRPDASAARTAFSMRAATSAR